MLAMFLAGTPIMFTMPLTPSACPDSLMQSVGQLGAYRAGEMVVTRML
jgi:hypothetical protein